MWFLFNRLLSMEHQFHFNNVLLLLFLSFMFLKTNKSLSLWKESSFCRSQNILSFHSHQIHYISHRTHIISDNNIKWCVTKLTCLIIMFPLHIHFFSKSHNNSIIRVTSFFTFRTNHIVHIKRTSYHNTTDIQCIIDCLDCTNSKWSIVWIPVTSLYKLPLISWNTGIIHFETSTVLLWIYQIITGIHTYWQEEVVLADVLSH